MGLRPRARFARAWSSAIKRRLTVFQELAIVWFVLGLSENSTVRPPQCPLMISTIGLAENDDSEACERILEICNPLGRNGV